MNQPWIYKYSPSQPPSHLPLHPIPLGLPSAPGPSAHFFQSTFYFLDWIFSIFLSSNLWILFSICSILLLAHPLRVFCFFVCFKFQLWYILAPKFPCGSSFFVENFYFFVRSFQFFIHFKKVIAYCSYTGLAVRRRGAWMLLPT